MSISFRYPVIGFLFGRSHLDVNIKAVQGSGFNRSITYVGLLNIVVSTSNPVRLTITTTSSE